MLIMTLHTLFIVMLSSNSCDLHMRISKRHLTKLSVSVHHCLHDDLPNHITLLRRRSNQPLKSPIRLRSIKTQFWQLPWLHGTSRPRLRSFNRVKIWLLHRKLGGIFQLLRRLDVSLDLVPYWERMVESQPPSSERTHAA